MISLKEKTDEITKKYGGGGPGNSGNGSGGGACGGGYPTHDFSSTRPIGFELPVIEIYLLF